jgi:MoaA/NifB/PqqE/SkfB family radical SAM enzyme
MISRDRVPPHHGLYPKEEGSAKMNIYAADDIGYYDENEIHLRNKFGQISYWPGCQAGLTVVGIDSNGNVKGCESLYADDFIEGNVREESLSAIWHYADNFSYNRQFHK